MKLNIFQFFILASLLCFAPVSAEAGLWTWLFGPSDEEKFKMDTGSNITAYASTYIAELKKKAEKENKPSTEQKTAIQIGKIHGSIFQTVTDYKWYGDLTVTVKADYSATFGLPYDLIEKGIRIEKDYTTTGLFVIVSAPLPLSVAVDTDSIYLQSRSGTWTRKGSKTEGLEIEAHKSLTRLATIDARQRCQDKDTLAMTRAVVLDVVLDMAGELYSKKVKRALAPHTTVIFENELNLNDLKRRTIPLTPFEIDAQKSNSVRVRSVR